MKKELFLIPALVLTISALIFLQGCSTDEVITSVFGTPDAVYTETNQTGGNNVMMYSRASDGTLSLSNTYSTGGTGTGMGLGSQGAVRLTDNGSFLLAVNAGSNDISVFAVNTTGLEFKSRTASGGTMPISVAARNGLVYVLNAGGSGNISGFRLNSDGTLTAIAGSSRNLSNNGSGAAPGPAQVEFNTSGNVLMVTEKMTNRILTYTVNSDGTVNGPNINASVGRTPFGFAFRNDNQVIVSEAFGGGIDSSAVSSYASTGTTVSVITGPVFTTETAACWIVITNNGNYTYTSNTGSGSITGYSINTVGALSILTLNGVTASTGTGSMPIDMALSSNSGYLFVLNSGNGSIGSFRVNSDGSLTAVNTATVSGLPAGTTGLAAK